MPLILCSVASVFLLHQKTDFAINLLAIGSNAEPKLGVSLLLTILFYNHICSSAEKYNKYNDFHDKLVSFGYFFLSWNSPLWSFVFVCVYVNNHAHH